MKSRFNFALVAIFIPIFTLTLAAIDSEIENKNVERSIDIASQLVKINYKLSIGHLGKKPISVYSFILPEDEALRLSYISARDGNKKELKIQETKVSSGQEYLITFNSASVSQNLVIETVFTKSLIPHPSKITQSEKQLVRYFGNAYFYSPYKTATQKTMVQLSSTNVESHTNTPSPVVLSSNKITYGPYDNVDALQSSKIIIHYENQTPFLTVTKLERSIEISHWGNIAIEETIDMLHTGAELKGSFSRYDFQKDGRSGQASVKNYKTILPASADHVYYRDTNGNISTSNMKTLKDSVEIDLRPRFPLFGGWKTHYTIGYNVPSFEYLFNKDNNYLLKMRLIDHIFDDMVIDEARINIILPEGSNNIKLITPYGVTRLPDSLHYTYLDTFGRPVISFVKKNLVENHIHDLNLKYNFAKVTMLQEPLLLIGFFFTLFLVVIICLRLDFSIHKDRENAHQHKE